MPQGQIFKNNYFRAWVSVFCLVEDLRSYRKELATEPVRRNAGNMAGAFFPAGPHEQNDAEL